MTRLWIGEPVDCTCTRLIVATLDETLDCPMGWQLVPGIGYVHTGRKK